ncbi:MAG TPA: hypothetical protein VJO32_02375 [Ktedonobacteraceae bacterium]|nr:hypothetical protein [Ktedonobacteraceae bacterium]
MTVRQRPPGESLPTAWPRPPGRRRLNWQLIARTSWIVLAIMLLVIFVANLPALYQYARTVCPLPDVEGCPTYQFTPVYVQILEQLHLSVTVAKILLATLCVVVSVLYWLVGLLIFWRKSHEWMGLFASMLLIMFASSGFLGFNLSTQSPPLFQLLAQFITHWLMWPAMLAFLFTFPTGRFTPRWTWAAFVPFFVVAMLASIPVSVIYLSIPSAAIILASLLPVGVQIYRYARVYDDVQRQQTKWFVFGLSVFFLLLIIQGILREVAPVSTAANSWYQLFNGSFWLIPWTTLLLVVSIPILRYRLWDIDVIINRALVYGSLTVLLGALYAGLILALQFLMHTLTGGSFSEQPLVIVGSTLVIAALFQPLRRRLQAIIDRRFYRRKYDMAKIMADFSVTLRNEVELDQLREQLVAVVQETMQPSHVFLWVPQPGWVEPSSLQPGKASRRKPEVHEEIQQ